MFQLNNFKIVNLSKLLQRECTENLERCMDFGRRRKRLILGLQFKCMMKSMSKF